MRPSRSRTGLRRRQYFRSSLIEKISQASAETTLIHRSLSLLAHRSRSRG
jgi:hypothetical protein